MVELLYSSETYKIDPRDIVVLKDSLYPTSVSDEVVVLIGNDQQEIEDTLVKGREIVEKAVNEGMLYIPVRVAFISRVKKYDILTPLVRKWRYKYRSYSSHIYHMNPVDIREMKIERGIRNSENAYQFSNPKFKMSEVERKKTYSSLVDSMKTKGYDDNFPLDIMLCRNMGIQDTLNQGHHRMGIAIDTGLSSVAVKFSAVGQAPKFLHPLFKLIAKINLYVRHLLKV